MSSSACREPVKDALEPYTEPGTPTLKLYEYVAGDREASHLDIDEYLRAMRLTRTLVARVEHRTRTEWIFPAISLDDAPGAKSLGCTDAWVLVFESNDEDEWHHTNRIHESSVINRGIPARDEIMHVNEVDTVVPAVAMANQVEHVAGDE